ncbi:MAG: hypothetical protein WCK48_00045 [bacterium]
MTIVVPAIIPKTREQTEEEISRVASFAHLIQIDISDGMFTPVKTWPYNGRDIDFFEKLKTEAIGWPRWEDVDFEIHLMVKNPEDVVRDWIYTGVSAIVAHIEATDNFQKVIDICKENLVTVGIAIKPSTDLSKLDKFVSQVDFIQCMGNDSLGKHGAALDLKVLNRISQLHGHYPNCIIGIDIGVTEETAKSLVKAGAKKLITGSAILDADNPEEVFEEFSSYTL